MAEIEEESNNTDNSQNLLKKLSEFPAAFYSEARMWFDKNYVRNLIDFHYCYAPLASVVILPGENPPEII